MSEGGTAKRVLIATLVLLGVVSGACAQQFEPVDAGDYPDLARMLELREPLYPSGNVASADGLDINSAYYQNPTDRYGHNIGVGESATLGVAHQTGALKLDLEEDVFEDGTPRITDLDGDGRGEIITIRSSQTQGSRIAIYAVRNGALVLAAETPAIGTRNRWMNIAGIADFNGDGLTDIALVDRPHIRGELELWTYDGTPDLKRITSQLGFSNHFIGSPAQNLSAVVPSKKGPLLVLPDTERRSLRLVSFRNDRVTVLDDYALPAPIDENFAVHRTASAIIIAVLLADGSVKVVQVEH